LSLVGYFKDVFVIGTQHAQLSEVRKSQGLKTALLIDILLIC